jgi:hypothetical protein
MALTEYGIPIPETKCLGDSLWSINAALTALDQSAESKVSKEGDTMTGDLDLSCNKLKHFGVDVKEVTITNATPNQKYTIQSDDCGKVIVINGGITSYIGAPAGLPIGFNIMIISNSDYGVNIIPDVGGNGVSVNNIDDKVQIKSRYGICNFICFQPNKIMISGDLI